MPPLSNHYSFVCSGSCAALHGGDDNEEDADDDCGVVDNLNGFKNCVKEHGQKYTVGLLIKIITTIPAFTSICVTFELIVIEVGHPSKLNR